jgi:hypothetical protein
VWLVSLLSDEQTGWSLTMMEKLVKTIGLETSSQDVG